MSIRNCAMQDPAFQKLYYAYTNRDEAARAWKASGGKVLGELGCDIPDELVLAAGLFPVHVYADPAKPLTFTDKYLEFSFDPRVRKQFEKLVDGSYGKLLNYLAVSNSTDVIIRVFLYLREILRSEPEMKLPPVAFVDWLFTRNRIYQERNEFVVKLFWDQLEEWSGRKISGDAVEAAALICNRDREALRKISALRKGEICRVNGSEALVIIGSALFMERKEHTRLVEDLAVRAAEWPEVSGPRLYMTGSTQEDLTLYGLVEEAGGVIIAEDHDWGDRYYERDYNTAYSPIRALVDRYMLRSFSSKKAFVSQRVKALDDAVDTCGADAVLFYSNLYEESASWDYPSQKASLEGRGIPTVCFAKMQYPVEDNDGLSERIQEFITAVKEAKK